MFDIKENLSKLPDAPGVYMHKDSLGEIIYVGKAVSLRNRVRQYFQSSKNKDLKVVAMVEHIDSFEYIRCSTEKEALILENNLIKKHKPKYNVLLRDDKTYPYIKITSEKWPRIEKTRRLLKDGAKYFGPYTDVKAVNEIVDLLSRVYQLKKCQMKSFPKGFKPCLNYHIQQCKGMCIGREDKQSYENRVKEVEAFLKGRSMNIINFLEENMKSAAENLEYEKAAIYRDQINSAKALLDKQRVNLKRDVDMDVLIAGSNEDIILFRVENGVLSSREIFYMDGASITKAERVEAFLKQHYSKSMEGVSEIILDENIEDKSLIEEFLRELWKKKVRITENPRGEKKRLLDLAKQDAFEFINVSENHRRNIKEKEDKIEESLAELVEKAYKAGDVSQIVDNETGEIIDLFEDSTRVEAYDISNTNGSENVGVMVVFEGLKKNKKAYRKFRVSLRESKPDDYASMREVVYRRLNRAMQADKSFLPLPKIMLIDGGLGHISGVQELITTMKLPICVVGMVKDDGHRTNKLVYFKNSVADSLDKMKGEEGYSSYPVKNLVEEIDLKEDKKNKIFFSYIGRIQEEVHRFAIDYHRGLRSKSMLKSVLEDIEGIGPKKREELLKHFGSVDRISGAKEEELVQVASINRKDARAIVRFFKEV